MPEQWLKLEGKICVVTGAGGGIGREIARALARNGARLVVHDRDRDAGEKTRAAIQYEGGEAISQVGDITDPDAMQRAAASVREQLGPCDVLVNNAAVVRNGPIADLSLADWSSLLDVNLTGYFLCSQIFGAMMRQNNGGSIVHLASISGDLPQPNGGAYSASKAAVRMLSRQLALEWGKDKIRSNVVSPAMVMTPMTESIYSDSAVRIRREQAIPLGRIGQPGDTANAVCFLASDRASYITGQELIIDGGWTSSLLATVPRPGFDAEPAT